MSGPILIIGGGGVFGSRIAQGLLCDGVENVVIAGRRNLDAFAKDMGCRAIALDRESTDLGERLQALQPFCVIDAAGPFQAYGDEAYRLAKATVSAGSHYLDLSDDGVFTKEIVKLDDAAKAKGVVVRSGVSSVPAISAAAVRALSEDMRSIDLIDTAILPGNRAPRGLSVMRAILAQVGKPLGGDVQDIGWIGAKRIEVETPAGVLRRWASPIGAPDLHLMKQAFGAKEVRFRAGLELSVMHLGLGFLARLVKWRVLPSALPFVGGLHRVASWLEPFGTDRGAMIVRVLGDGLERKWTLFAEAGDGPHVPALPARIVVRKLLQGGLPVGAAPALYDLELDEVEAAATELQLSFARHSEG